jgi:hypothetical protein
MKYILSAMMLSVVASVCFADNDQNSSTGVVQVTAKVPAFTEIKPPSGWPFQASISWDPVSSSWSTAGTTLELLGVQKISAKLQQDARMFLEGGNTESLPFLVKIDNLILSKDLPVEIYKGSEVHRKVTKSLEVTAGNEAGAGRPTKHGNYSGSVTIMFEPA